MKLIPSIALFFIAAFAGAQNLQPTITWGPISAITQGAALTPTQLNATANVSGTFTYTPAAGTILTPGVNVISVVFTPSDTVDFTTAAATNTILVVTPSTTHAYSFNLPAVDSLDWGALINANMVAIDNILSGVTPLTGTLNAPTASALAAPPTHCSAGQSFSGIDVHGNSVGCFTPSGSSGSGLSSFTVGNLAPLFTASLGSSPLTNPALAFTLSTAPANSVFGNFTGAVGLPGYSAAPVFSAANLTNFPTLNQNTTGNAATATLATSALAAPYSGLTGTVPTWNQSTTGTAANITGVLNAASEPAHTGDVTNTAGSLAMTVTRINGVQLSTMSSGLLKNVTGTGAPTIAFAGVDYVIPSGNAANVSGIIATDHGGTNTSSPAFATQTDGATVTWATSAALVANATLTMVHTTATRAINLTGLVSGGSYVLILKQDSTGGAAATLGTGCTWFQGGSAGFTTSTTLALTTTASAINILAFTYDGLNCYANLR